MPLGGRRQLALLALLILNANRAVSGDVVTDAVWGDIRSGGDGRLPMAITRLRKALEPLGHRTGERRLRGVSGGYLLSISPGELDAEVFGWRVQEARRALQSGDAARAAQVVDRALELWRGPPLAEVAFADFAQPDIRRFEELRLIAIAARAEAQLALGDHVQVVAELAAPVTEHPTQERLAAQLMVALYRCGRQADALEVYQRTRAHLARELGLDPGPVLRQLQVQILEQAPSLETERAGLPPFAARPVPSASAPTARREHRKAVTALSLGTIGSWVSGGHATAPARRVLARLG